MKNKKYVIITVPCFSGAPWDLQQLKPIAYRKLKTMRLPEGIDSVNNYADFLKSKVAGTNSYVLVGDSFGAVISLAFASRRPKGLKALVLSGGFAANPVESPFLQAIIKAARFLPGPFYRNITLRIHAALLESPYDNKGQTYWSKEKSRELFIRNTSYHSYVSRAKAVLSCDYRSRLHLINVPTLIITPGFDRLIGKDAAAEMLNKIPDATEVVLKRTGHMLRFSHPITYADTIEGFLKERVDCPAENSVK
jgi:pimeloyl-ACP methyl ester carboxylesterase